jgi:hypothetical protein
MEWLTNLFKVITSVVVYLQQLSNPENRRLRTIEELSAELDKLRVRRDQLLAMEVKTDEAKESIAVELGIVVQRIIFLRTKRDSLKR